MWQSFAMPEILNLLRWGNPANSELSQERLKQNVTRFIIVKLFLTLIGLVIYLPLLASRGSVSLLLVATAADWFFLIPYYRWAIRNVPLAIRFTWVSLALTAIAMTIGVYLAGGFAHPLVLTYFGIIPLALMIIPHPAIIWSTAGTAIVAYLALVLAQIAHVVPSASEMNEWSWLHVAVVILGLGFEAILLMIYIVHYEDRRQETERRVRAETIWSTIGKTVISTQDLDQVLTTVIQIINEKMRVETGSILLREPGTDQIVFAKILRGNIEHLASVRLRVGEGIVGWVIASGKPALVPKVSHDPRWNAKVDRETGFVTHSILCVPLIARDEIIGAIELLNKLDGTFNEADLQLLESIAAPVAIAIQNARLHRQIINQLENQRRLFLQVEHAKKEWETTVDAIDAGIVLTDEQGYILRVNHTLAKWVKSTSRALVGQVCWRAIHNMAEPPPYCPHAQMAVRDKQYQEAEMEDPFLGGIFRATAYPLYDTNGKFVGAVSVLKNITEEKRLQAQLIHSEKLAAMGRLAATLAHEINNPLQGVQGCLDLVQVDPSDPQQQEFLALARKEVGRLTAMTRNMLNYYRPSKGVPTRVSIPNLVQEVLVLSAGSFEHLGIRVETEWQADLPAVNGVEDQLRQVMLNLVLNATEAMPNGGVLQIRGRVEEERWLTIQFADSGARISAHDLPHVFEPFFTTKERGTGLGLAVSHSIVTNHGGRLTVDSETGKGSTFTVWLPIPNIATQLPAISLNDSV
jgi:signal transduction histidine kinase